jgi:dipeptidyl aminopeptidase/acylaminoacyl peptidase
LSTLTGATAASGSATLTINASTSGSVELFVVTKTSAVGSVTVAVGNTVTTYFVKGTAGAVAKVALATVASGIAGSTQSVVVSAFDQYDNAKGSGSVNLVINTNGVVTTTTVTTAASGTISHTVTLPTTGSVTVIAFAASSSAVATIAITQPRNLQAELDKALADLAAEKVAHAVTKQNLAAEKEANDSNKLQLVSISAELTAARAKLTEVEGLTAKEVRKLKWQYNTVVKKYNVGKPKSQRLAFIK